MQKKLRMSALHLFKILLSIPIGIGLVYPFMYPNVSGGVLVELKIFGPVGSVVAIIFFLMLILLYALDLIKSLKLVAPASRKASPKSVWLMFLIPYNFIEDFFIVYNVALSLKTEASHNPRLARFKSFGKFSGLGWCSSQIVSLLPNQIGLVAGLVALVFWAWHWVFICRINKALLGACDS